MNLPPAARHLAYPSIVGSGANACTLHYLNNDGLMRDGELVLIDAGCELEYYAADVTPFRLMAVSAANSAPCTN